MLSARGFIKSDNNRLVGTFDINGGQHHISVTIKPLSLDFKCSSAILTYSNVEKLVEDGNWSGSIGKTELRISTGNGVSIIGPFDAPRPSTLRVRGAGTWETGAAHSLLSNSTKKTEVNVIDLSDGQFQPLDAVEDPVKVERERRLLMSGAPIIAYAAGRCALSAPR